MNEDASVPKPRMIQTASGLKPMPTAAELNQWARESAREALREAGKQGTNEEIDAVLNSEPPIDIPPLEQLIK